MDAKERVILAGLNTRSGESSSDSTMDELEALVETAGGTALARVIQQRDTPDTKFFIGEGKAEEIALLCGALEADTVVFDNDLSPSQTRALEELLGVPVVDRSLLILDIFADRAQSREGRVQVELARLKYILPRLTGKGVQMSRLGGGGGGSGGARRGAGETRLETDRRHIRARIDKLSRDLEEIRRTRQVQRRQRQKNEIPTVALIGYTNAGKSTLLNLLCRESIQAKNRLFDTLDTTTRRWRIDAGQTVLLSDTVGFIRKLPHHLIEAFRSTLEELACASLLLHVIDLSHPEWAEQSDVVDSLVTQLGAQQIPCLRLYNKADLVEADILPGGIIFSARTGAGTDELAAAVKAALAGV